jgi:hypothetical protein
MVSQLSFGWNQLWWVGTEQGSRTLIFYYDAANNLSRKVTQLQPWAYVNYNLS